MRWQSASNCGPASVAHVLGVLGVKNVGQEVVEQFIAATERKKTPVAREGTTQDQLVKALNRWANVTYSGCITTAHLASYTLRGALAWGSAAILGVDNTDKDGHWIAAIGMSGENYIVMDSADNEILVTYTEEQLLQRWATVETKRGKQVTFFELIVVEAKR